MITLDRFAASTRACLQTFLSADPTDEPELADVARIQCVYVPRAQLVDQTLTHILARHCCTLDASGIAIDDLLLTLVADRPTLEHQLVQDAFAAQWWRLTRHSVKAPRESLPRSAAFHTPTRGVALTPRGQLCEGTTGMDGQGRSVVHLSASVAHLPPLSCGSTPASTPTRTRIPLSPSSLTAAVSTTATGAALITNTPDGRTGAAPDVTIPSPPRNHIVREVRHFLDALIRCLSIAALHRHAIGLVPTGSRHVPCESQTARSRTMEGPSCDSGEGKGVTTMPHYCTARSLLRHTPARMEESGSIVGACALASTGCKSLDAALKHPCAAFASGGFRYGWLTEVAGEAGSGKTQLVLQCLLQQIASDAVAPILLDCDVTASSRRDPIPISRAYLYIVSEQVPVSRLGALAKGTAARTLASVSSHFMDQISESALPQASVSIRQKLAHALTAESLLARLQVKMIRDLVELQALLAPDGVLEKLADAHGKGGCMLALDSIAAAVTGGERTETNGQLGQPSARPWRRDDTISIARVGLTLKSFAVRHQACVLVVNQVRGVPAAAHIATAPLKRRRDADMALQSVRWAAADDSLHPTRTGPSPSSFSSLSTAPHLGKHVEVLPALGAAWSTSSWHMRVMLTKTPTVSTAGETTPAVCQRECLVYGGPDLPPARHRFFITEDGIVDDAL